MVTAHWKHANSNSEGRLPCTKVLMAPDLEGMFSTREVEICGKVAPSLNKDLGMSTEK